MRPLAHSIATAATSVAALVGVACDSTPRGRDASAGSQRVAEVAVRFEVAGDGAPSVSMLAYQAAVSGAGTDDILSVVDPLTAPAPEGFCSFRDVAGAARALGAAGGKVELEALPGWRLDLGDGRALNAAARVFPDIASVVGGVVAELGPVDLRAASRGLGGIGLVNDGETAGLPGESLPAPAWPSGLALMEASGARFGLNPPRPVQLIGPQGTVLPANSTISVSSAGTANGELVFGLGAAESVGPPAFLELRPFGATWALACPAVGRDRVVIPAVEVARLTGLKVPVSVEAVSRESRGLVLGGAPVRLTVEVRASSVVELRP
ncbi:MAG TPA: hypothetical protein VGG33_04820 [Polyangia bacterium]